MTSEEIKSRLINNDALFNNIYMIEQTFDILPNDHDHFGAAISYQDIQELRADFLSQLVDTVVDWVYSSEKYADLRQQFMASGKTEAAATSHIIRKATQKFRRGEDSVLIQGQLGELLLFHFIQRVKGAIPLLRKMPITTSPGHERFGSDALHYKVEGNNNVIILGEAKAYTSKYSFNSAFENAVNSILTSYKNLRNELNLYLHEDFLDNEMDHVAESFLNNTLPNVRVELMNLILYNENQAIPLTDEFGIKSAINAIIQERYRDFDNGKIDMDANPILKRITYIVFPIWNFEKLVEEFQKIL